MKPTHWRDDFFGIKMIPGGDGNPAQRALENWLLRMEDAGNAPGIYAEIELGVLDDDHDFVPTHFVEGDVRFTASVTLYRDGRVEVEQ